MSEGLKKVDEKDKYDRHDYRQPGQAYLTFALPLLLGNLFQQLYNMVDSLSSGLAIGIGIIVSQFYGAKNEQQVRNTIANSIYVLATAALAVSVLGILLCPALLRLLQTPEHIMEDATLYLRTTCAGIIAIALYNGVAAVLRALGDSRTPLYFLILSSVVNVILDLAFVIYCDMGVFGVALATIISQAVSAVTCLLYAYHKVPYFRLTREELRPHKAIILKSFRLGIPMALQSSMIAISCMVLQGVVNSFGDTVMAAFTITSRVEQIIQQPFNSLGTAMTTYAGQNMGAGKPDRVRKGLRQATLMILAFCLLMVPIFFLLGPQIVRIFVKEQDVIEMGYRALRITSLFYFGLGMIYVPRGLLNGCGDTAFSMINGITEVACRIGYSQILLRIPILGYWSVWITTGLTWITVATVCMIRYLSGKWRQKGLVQERELS